MREELDTLVEELKKLKKSGVASVLMEKDTLNQLDEKVAAIAATLPQPHNEVDQSVSSAPQQTRVPEPKQPSPAVAKVPEKPKEVLDYHTIPTVVLPDGPKQEKWDFLKNQVLNCKVCNNHVQAGKKVVFGVGSVDADIFFCGEAPGAEEEKVGEPFVGPAGQLLTKIIQAMGLTRNDVYIGNIMNWRPETDSPYGNRPPTQDEMAFCLPYLKAQVEIVQPKAIVALGATAVHGLLGYDRTRSITRTRGEWREFENTPTIISYHPSYVLRNGTNKVKRQVWEDMLAVMEKLNMPISERQRGFFK